MPVTLDYAPGYAAIVNARQDKLAAQQARLVAYDAAPTEYGANDSATPYYFPIGDETTTITAGTAKLSISFPFAFHVTGYVATLATASSSGVVTLDINDAGATTITTKLTIDANETTSATAATPYVLSDVEVAANAVISVDVDAAGTGAKGLKLWVFGYRV